LDQVIKEAMKMKDKKKKYEPPLAMRLDDRDLVRGDYEGSGSGDHQVCLHEGLSASGFGCRFYGKL